ncbi:hypothetical protein ACHAWF_011381 [Thalassiosira exigua]
MTLRSRRASFAAAVAAAIAGAAAAPQCCAFSTIAPVVRGPGGARRASSLTAERRARTDPSSARPSSRFFGTALRASSSSSPSGKTKPPPLPTTDDPFVLLGLNPTADKKEIKRAYRKRAMQYHPDVIVGPESSEAERAEASRNFARINAAYEMLNGGGTGGVGTGGASTGSGGAKTTSGGYQYQPPHRRTSGYSGSYGKSTNWEDFMPNYDEEDSKYDADGDSFGAIFSDVLTGAAGYAAAGRGSGGIVGDFIDFLERNVDGFESGYDDDKSLSQLLLYGSFDEVADEMDETDVLVTSLETKMSTIQNELMQAQADLTAAVKFSEKLDIEERVAELKAREKVVKGYLKKGKKRLIRLRERYKELMVEGRGGRGYGGASQGGSRRSGRSQDTGSYRQASEPAPPASSSAPASSAPSSAPSSSSSNSWRNEGFSGSYGRRSSSSRRSSRRNRGSEKADEPSTTSAASDRMNRQQRSPPDAGQQGRVPDRGNSAPQPYEAWVPPHRRTQSSAERVAEDKKRLRDLKVEDDFEKLKREMGM